MGIARSIGCGYTQEYIPNLGRKITIQIVDSDMILRPPILSHDAFQIGDSTKKKIVFGTTSVDHGLF